jgi:DNA-binding beta-propeller fold protein YncE
MLKTRILLREWFLLSLCLAAPSLMRGQTVSGTINGIFTDGMAVNPITNQIYVGGAFGVIDGSTNAFTQYNDSNAFNPFLPGVDPISGLIFFADYGNGGSLGGYSVFNTLTSALVDGYVSDGTFTAAVNPVTHVGYLTMNLGGLVVVDGATSTYTTLSPADGGPSVVAVNPVTNKIYSPYFNYFGGADGVMVVDGATNTFQIIASRKVSNASAVAVNPATNFAYVAYFGSDNIMVIDGANNGYKILADPNAQAPISIAVNPVTNKIYVANRGNTTGNHGNITVVDGATDSVTTLIDPNAAGPAAVAYNPTTNQIFVANAQSNNVTVIDGTTNAI